MRLSLEPMLKELTPVGFGFGRHLKNLSLV